MNSNPNTNMNKIMYKNTDTSIDTRIIDDDFDYTVLQDDDVITLLGYKVEWKTIKEVMDERNLSYDESLPIIICTIKNIIKLKNST